MSKVETRVEALQRQQMILTVLDYYKGKCDGIWGPASFEAMREFEASGKFSPAIPRGGNPLVLTGRMPPGIYRDTVTAHAGEGLLTCAGLTAEKIEELAGDIEQEASVESNVVADAPSDDGSDSDDVSSDSEGDADSDGNADAGEASDKQDQSGSQEVELADMSGLSKKEKKRLRQQQQQQKQS